MNLSVFNSWRLVGKAVRTFKVKWKIRDGYFKQGYRTTLSGRMLGMGADFEECITGLSRGFLCSGGAIHIGGSLERQDTGIGVES